MFHRYPTSVDQHKQKLPESITKSYFSNGMKYSQNFGGVDGLILGNMASILNFTVIIKDEKNHYGGQMANGTFIG